jgi:hypothetical protein
LAPAGDCLRANSAAKGRTKITAENRKTEMNMRFGLGILAYVVPTFALGFIWHLILSDGYYEQLAIYRKDIIVPFGFTL